MNTKLFSRATKNSQREQSPTIDISFPQNHYGQSGNSSRTQEKSYSSDDYDVSDMEEGVLKQSWKSKETSNRQNSKPYIQTSAQTAIGKLKQYNTNVQTDPKVKLEYGQDNSQQQNINPNMKTNTHNNVGEATDMYRQCNTLPSTTKNSVKGNKTLFDLSQQVSQGAQNEDLQKHVYHQMFKELMKQRERSPLQKRSSQDPMSKYSPSELKHYFVKKTNNDFQKEVKKLNKSCSQRLMEQGNLYQLKKDIIGKFEQLKQMDGCSFIPEVNRSNSPQRSIEVFAKDQSMFQMSKQLKIRERKQEEQQSAAKRMNERHISKGSLKLVKSMDRGDSSFSISQQYEKGKDKLLKMTIEENEIKKYLNEKSSWPQQRNLMSSQSLRDLRNQSRLSGGDSSVNSTQELFYPTINKKSKNLKRDDSVGNILYQDAQDKIERQKVKEKKYAYNFDPSSSKMSDKVSESYLVNAFCAEFNKAIVDYTLSESYDSVIAIFQGMGFLESAITRNRMECIQLISDCNLVQILKEMKLKTQNLFILMSAIMNINTSNQIKMNKSLLSINTTHNQIDKTSFEDVTFQNEQPSEYLTGVTNQSIRESKISTQVSKILTQSQNSQTGQLELSQNSVKIIHSYFLPLYYQRLNFVSQRRKSSNSTKREANQTKQLFKPILNTKSVKMADKILKKYQNSNLNNSKHFDILLSKGQQYKNKINQESKLKSDKELVGCTFKPHISKVSKQLVQSSSSHLLKQQSSQEDRFTDLFNEHKVKKNRVDKTTEQIEFEESYQECTFQPNKFKTIQSNNVTVEKSYQSSKINTTNQSIMKKQMNSNAAPSNPKRKDWNSKIASNISTPIKIGQNEPAFIVGIELEGVNFKINLFDGDRPDEVIQKFCKEKNLSERVQFKILKLVEQQFKQAIDSKHQEQS